MTYAVIQQKPVAWVDIVNPTQDDMAKLSAEFPFLHPLNLEDCLTPNERPKIDEYADHLFIVMIFPYWDKQAECSRPAEIHFFIGKGFLITVHETQIKSFNALIANCTADKKMRQKVVGTSSAHLLHYIIDSLVDHIFPMLRKVDGHIAAIEETLFSANAAQTIRRISVIRRDMIALRRIISPQVAILDNLQKIKRPYIDARLTHYFNDTLDHIKKAHDILEEDMDVITHLAETNNALSTHQINEIMRILTVISVIILPLTLIAGIFGMNYRLPLEDHPYAFWFTSALMLAIVFGLIIYFRRQHWL